MKFFNIEYDETGTISIKDKENKILFEISYDGIIWDSDNIDDDFYYLKIIFDIGLYDICCLYELWRETYG